MRGWLRGIALGLPLLLPGGVLGVALTAPAPHSLDYWVAHTPRCLGPVCVNVWPDHIDLSLAVPLP